LPTHRPAPRHCVFEPLENRRLYSATAVFKNERLTITGTDILPTRVVVTTTSDNDRIVVTIDGVEVDPKPGGETTVQRKKVKKIWVTTGAGDDVIIMDMLAGLSPERQRETFCPRCVIDAGAGNDTVTGGPHNDSIIGGPGDDAIAGGNGNDVLYGGTGNDALVGGTQKDNLFGQDGNDILNGEEGTDNLYGMEGDDILTGGDGSDFLNGGSGSNTQTDGNNAPFQGKRGDITRYLNEMVTLTVPEKFRSSVFT
jgi:Ca2+-binding RTX toxin-like protein